jgi:hypothetical protein
MKLRNARVFFNGLALGMTLSFMVGMAVVYLLTVLEIISVSMHQLPRLQLLIDWSSRNLGLSIWPFGVTLVLYIHNLRTLQQRLIENRPVDEIVQLEHLSDIWTSLFFGIGVIWTAIGMRGALLYALGDSGAVVEASPYSVLQRLVEGGILTALTTTIVGAVGGYVMRVMKSSLLGTRLSRYYEAQEKYYINRVEALLTDIRDSIDHVGARRSTAFVLQEKP